MSCRIINIYKLRIIKTLWYTSKTSDTELRVQKRTHIYLKIQCMLHWTISVELFSIPEYVSQPIIWCLFIDFFLYNNSHLNYHSSIKKSQRLCCNKTCNSKQRFSLNRKWKQLWNRWSILRKNKQGPVNTEERHRSEPGIP